MSFIVFDDSLKVGNRLIDQEHETLIDYVNLLEQAVSNNASKDIIGQVVQGLVEYTKTHFFVEEELMKAYGYPDIESHLKAHEGFRQEIDNLVEQLDKGESIDLNAVLEFLKKWLTNHILIIDAKLSEFLADKMT